ncbi:MAG: hypothetical protein HQ505_06855 [Nitrosopumilus sp.]|nr:hypothetical protein [Nitrosopumilus sp.]
MKNLEHNTPSISKRIEELYKAMKHLHDVSDIASNINDILIYGNKVPSNIVSGAWDLFAQKKGVI